MLNRETRQTRLPPAIKISDSLVTNGAEISLDGGLSVLAYAGDRVLSFIGLYRTS